MIVRVVYESGRIDLFDTLTFTAGSPFGSDNVLTELSIDPARIEEEGLWLTVSWYAARREYRESAEGGAIPVARRSKGWRMLLSAKDEVAGIRRVELDGSTLVERVGCSLVCFTKLPGEGERRTVEEDWGDVDEAGW